MIQVAEKLIEAVNGRQKFVQVTQMVLAELAGCVALVLKQVGDGNRFPLQPLGSGGYADFGKAGAIDALPGDER